MALDSGFVEDIEDPDHSALNEALTEACERTADRLRDMGLASPEDWLVRKTAFAYFYDWEQDSPEYAFVLPDPGNLGERFTAQTRELSSAGPDIPYHRQVEFYRQLAIEWFTEKNTDFSQQFFSTLDANGIVEYPGSWRTYIQSGDVFDDFYMTDVLKYRVGGYNSGGDRERAAFHHQLKQELTEIDPAIVFVFGSSAWNTARHYLNPKPVAQPVDDESSIMQTHGELYYTHTHIDAFLLPLSHMSGQVWWRFPPEDYINRLDAALTDFREVATDDLEVPDDLCVTEDGESQNRTALDSIAEDIGKVDEFGGDTRSQ